eukprot:CAMPEP_0119498636 /NCGR_PEP_ID=MMETSP1344-20130328/21333_1 /TAXON_ID=236787 /ORGANISM="Florenciella parvula, Strain CCMP2471" /LENGTH=112 /DNA_ID=CAMNT_0007534545 /DNA_START=196 /DNA_END=535 /DNA_ORIENTATION=-
MDPDVGAYAASPVQQPPFYKNNSGYIARQTTLSEGHTEGTTSWAKMGRALGLYVPPIRAAWRLEALRQEGALDAIERVLGLARVHQHVRPPAAKATDRLACLAPAHNGHMVT